MGPISETKKKKNKKTKTNPSRIIPELDIPKRAMRTNIRNAISIYRCTNTKDRQARERGSLWRSFLIAAISLARITALLMDIRGIGGLIENGCPSSSRRNNPVGWQHLSVPGTVFCFFGPVQQADRRPAQMFTAANVAW